MGALEQMASVRSLVNAREDVTLDKDCLMSAAPDRKIVSFLP